MAPCDGLSFLWLRRRRSEQPGPAGARLSVPREALLTHPGILAPPWPALSPALCSGFNPCAPAWECSPHRHCCAGSALPSLLLRCLSHLLTPLLPSASPETSESFSGAPHKHCWSNRALQHPGMVQPAWDHCLTQTVGPWDCTLGFTA